MISIEGPPDRLSKPHAFLFTRESLDFLKDFFQEFDKDYDKVCYFWF